MTKRAGAALLLATAALFLIANRASYKGYFQDDELNNISWTRDIPALDYGKAILTPKFFTNNFRPVGHYYYREMSLRYGLDFPKYLPIMHLAHILNIWLLWLLARQLGLAVLPASLGTLFFAFNMAVFEVYWKPMYVFDLFCTTLALACFLLYTRRRYVLSFCAFWLAYKSKELAVMVPVALLCYEFWLAEEKKWWPLIPFFAVSLSFGLQGVMLNPNVDNDYTFRFTPQAVWTSLSFYSSRILLIPYAGFALLALPLAVRDRRLWFGCAMLCLFFIPLMFLPGRLYSAYCYLPLTGVALMFATMAERKALTPLVALLCVAWIPWNIAELRRSRSQTLAIDNENRTYVAALADFARKSKNTRAFVYDGRPEALHVWGIEGALYYLWGRQPELFAIEDKGSAEALRREDVAQLKWSPNTRVLTVTSSKADTAYLSMNLDTPLWAFGPGWYNQEAAFRWSAPQASAMLTRPAAARQFELMVNLPPQQLKDTGPITVAVKLNGVEIGKCRLTSSGTQTFHWPAPNSGPDRVKVDIDVTPGYQPSNGDTRRLGIAVVGLGFR